MRLSPKSRKSIAAHAAPTSGNQHGIIIDMPGPVVHPKGSKKRKISDDLPQISHSKRRAVVDSQDLKDSFKSHVSQLEDQINESRLHYNNIVTLLAYQEDGSLGNKKNITAAVALCRTFCRLTAAGILSNSAKATTNEATIAEWLRSRYQEYIQKLLAKVAQKDSYPSSALMLLMRLVKEEATHLRPNDEHVWRNSLLTAVIYQIIDAVPSQHIMDEFLLHYISKFNDIKFYTFTAVANYGSDKITEMAMNRMIALLSAIGDVPNTKDDLQDFYICSPSSIKHRPYSVSAHKKQAQEAWMKLLHQNLKKYQRKHVLALVSNTIAPWFANVELLMDFLTDSFDIGGSTSLQALSGLYYLIREKNLDYPQFYQKLYSLLDSSILHSKHRSSFFRLLDTFLSSTHLPAALVASFIKRMSRLSLFGPPSGIVVVVPWIYNLMKNHPTCTLMLHREMTSDEGRSGIDEIKRDPFLEDEPDPMKTAAVDSSLWEIESLQSHYHPNVATIAKIISNQFTKQAYNIEDFLDHSYGSMLDAELSKDVRKAPVVEFEIPKKIFMKQDENMASKDNILTKMWYFD